LPTNKSFSKYIKGKSEDKFDKDLITQLAEHYQISKSEATEYAELLDKVALDRIITMYGYSETEKKRMLKGIK
jgi:hypothetical protein